MTRHDMTRHTPLIPLDSSSIDITGAQYSTQHQRSAETIADDPMSFDGRRARCMASSSSLTRHHYSTMSALFGARCREWAERSLTHSLTYLDLWVKWVVRKGCRLN